MIQKRMRMSMAVTLAMLFVMLAFGRGRLAPFYDDVGTAPPDAAEIIRTLFWPDHDGGDAGGGEAQGHLHNEIPQTDRMATPPATARSGGASPPAANPHQETAVVPAGESATVSPAPPAADVPAEEPAALLDSAAAEVEALAPLHDKLIEVLEAIHEALTDREEKRQARQQVVLARLAKSQQIRDLRLWVANSGKPGWSIPSARRRAARAKARLEHELAEARETLAKLRGPEPSSILRPS